MKFIKILEGKKRRKIECKFNFRRDIKPSKGAHILIAPIALYYKHLTIRIVV